MGTTAAAGTGAAATDAAQRAELTRIARNGLLVMVLGIQPRLARMRRR